MVDTPNDHLTIVIIRHQNMNMDKGDVKLSEGFEM